MDVFVFKRMRCTIAGWQITSASKPIISRMIRYNANPNLGSRLTAIPLPLIFHDLQAHTPSMHINISVPSIIS
jgi:hypothetical protein